MVPLDIARTSLYYGRKKTWITYLDMSSPISHTPELGKLMF